MLFFAHTSRTSYTHSGAGGARGVGCFRHIPTIYAREGASDEDAVAEEWQHPSSKQACQKLSSQAFSSNIML